jgi:hypothetical protein
MNNTTRPSMTIASRSTGAPVSVQDNALWNRLLARYVKPRAEEEKAVGRRGQRWTVEDIEAAVNRAVTAALRRHKERGESVVVWRDGQIVVLRPEEIDV